MNTNNLILLFILLLLLYYLYNINSKKKIKGGTNNIDFCKSTNYTTYECITQKMNDITNKSSVLNKEFNYNNFILSFTIGRNNNLLISELKGGILTIGSNNKNFHNLIFHIKNKELIVSQIGYNTHLSFNLENVSSANKLDFKFIYKAPYLNLYIIAYDSTNKEIENGRGYLNYLGELENVENSNFRLYLHPFINGWCSFGTTTFIKNNENLSEATGILNEVDTYLTNIKFEHIPREKTLINEETNINSIREIPNLDIKLNKIIILEIELNSDNLNKNCKLFNLNKFTNIINSDDNLELHKIDNKLFLKLINVLNDTNTDILKCDVNDNIKNIYIELIPFMNKHIFCLYVENNVSEYYFYRYTIDTKQFKNKTDVNNSGFSNIIINNKNEGDNNFKSLVKSFKLYTEDTLTINSSKYDTNIEDISTEPLIPTNITRLNETSVEFSYDKNVKLEYLKLNKTNHINYRLFIYNPYIKKYKLINNLQINKHNQELFTNVFLNIDDNSIGNKYKLETFSDLYYLQPINILNIESKNFEENTSNVLIQKNGEDVIWFFEKLKSDKITIYDYNIYDKENGKKIYINNDSQNGIFIIEPKSKNSDEFYIKMDGKYMYFEKDTNNVNIKFKLDKRNCEFKKYEYITYLIESTQNSNNVKNVEIKNDTINNIIEFYGIKNPYPKLYIYNNDLDKSLKPCSHIYSKQNSIIENMQAEITYISNRQDMLENNMAIDIDRPLHYWSAEETIDVIMFSHNLNKFPVLIPACDVRNGANKNKLLGLPPIIYYTADLDRDTNSDYMYYGPSTRPLDAVYPSEFIMKLTYDKNEQCYSFEFTQEIQTLKSNNNMCNIISGNKITSNIKKELDKFTYNKYKLGQYDILKSTKIYLEKVNGIYDYEFYIYTKDGQNRIYLDDSYATYNRMNVKTTTNEPDYSKLTSWHIVPANIIKKEYEKVIQLKTNNEANKLKYIYVLHTEHQYHIDNNDKTYANRYFEFNNTINLQKNNTELWIYSPRFVNNNSDGIYKVIMWLGHTLHPTNYDGDKGDAHGRIEPWVYGDNRPKFYADDILIFKDLNSTKEELKTYITENMIDIEKKLKEIQDNKKHGAIRGNMFGKKGAIWRGNNLMYNYCSNNLQFYNNKNYAYDYLNPDQKYYMMDKKYDKNYENKKRITTRELTLEEIKAMMLIEKLTTGFNIVGYTNNKNLNNSQPSNIFEIFKNSEKHFILEWVNNSNTVNFKNGVLVNIKSNNTFLKDIYITENIWEEKDLKKKITETTKTLYNHLSNHVNTYQPYPTFIYPYIKNNENVIENATETMHNEIKNFSTPKNECKNIPLQNSIPLTEKVWAQNEFNKIFDFFHSSVHTNLKELIDFKSKYNLLDKKLGGNNIIQQNIKKNNKNKLVKTKGGASNTFRFSVINKELFKNDHINSELISYETTLIDLYKKGMTPKYIKETKVNNYTWKLEFDGFYDPENTEFHLYCLNKNKYLINNQDKLEWSNNKQNNKGWKFLLKNASSDLSDTELQEKIKNYELNIKNIIINKFKDIYNHSSFNEIFIRKQTEKDKAQEEAHDKYREYVKQLRINNVKSIATKGCYLFSPNIGSFGKYVSHEYDNDTLDTVNESLKWETSSNNLIYIKHWNENNTNEIKNNDEIQISTYIKNTQYFLSTNIKSNKPVWTKNKNGTEPTRWIFECNQEVEFDINKIEKNDKLLYEDEIKQKYFLYKNDKITINVGILIKRYKRRWNGIYEAIKWAENDGKIPCRDYAWISEKNGYVFLYDDAYINFNKYATNNFNSNRNTVTEAWFVLHLNKELNKFYLDFNKLKYMVLNTVEGFFTYNSKDSRNYIVKEGKKKKLSLHSINDYDTRPPKSWINRQNFYSNQLTNDFKSCNYNITKPLYVWFKNPDNKYLTSNKKNKLEFKTEKNTYITGWHILMRNNPEPQPLYLKQYDENVNKPIKIFNYLFEIDETEQFYIYQRIKTSTRNNLYYLLSQYNLVYKRWDIFVSLPDNKFLTPIKGWDVANFSKNTWTVKNRLKDSLVPIKSSVTNDYYITFYADLVFNPIKNINKPTKNGSKTYQEVTLAKHGTDYKDRTKDENHTSKSTYEKKSRIKIYYITSGQYAGNYVFENLKNNTFFAYFDAWRTYGVDPCYWAGEGAWEDHPQPSGIDDILNRNVVLNRPKNTPNEFMFNIVSTKRGKSDSEIQKNLEKAARDKAEKAARDKAEKAARDKAEKLKIWQKLLAATYKKIEEKKIAYKKIMVAIKVAMRKYARSRQHLAAVQNHAIVISRKFKKEFDVLLKKVQKIKIIINKLQNNEPIIKKF